MATAKKALVDAATKTVTALVPVQYDLVDVAVGDTFDVRESDLPQLLEVNAVVETSTQLPKLPV
jgi:hypothetical protein